MSRSKKKYGIIKDKGFAKCSYNKLFRRVNKQCIILGIEPKLMREIVNDFDICDYKFRWSDYKESYPEKGNVYQKKKRSFFGK